MPEVSGPDQSRHETEAERLDRNLTELLQELRVAGIGVQMLFGFLLSIPFTTRFGRLDGAQRGIYTADVLGAALAIVLLGGPVAYHRLTFHRHQKAQLLRASNRMAIAGLGVVAVDVGLAVTLVLTFVIPGAGADLLASLSFVVFTSVWFVAPILARRRPGSEREAQ
jgi:hypothetical protein